MNTQALHFIQDDDLDPPFRIVQKGLDIGGHFIFRQDRIDLSPFGFKTRKHNAGILATKFGK